jgi:acyl transferase domain-containing protein
MSVLNRAARSAVCILFAATLAGFSWGNSEPDQRKAFIAFLQDINNRPGIHFLVTNANDEKAFGPYLQHYAIILDFDKDMKAPMQDFLAQLIKLGFGPNPSPRTIEQIAAAPADLTAAKDTVDKMEQGLETRLAKANADRAALKQPDDLKAVYDKTFDKLVTAPTVAFENSAKALTTGIDASLALVNYINAHRSKLIVSGMQIQAKDQRTLDELQPLMKAYQDAGERFIAAQRQSDRVLQGN